MLCLVESTICTFVVPCGRVGFQAARTDSRGFKWLVHMVSGRKPLSVVRNDVSSKVVSQIVHPRLGPPLRADRILRLGIILQLAANVCLGLKGFYVRFKVVKFICLFGFMFCADGFHGLGIGGLVLPQEIAQTSSAARNQQ